MNIKKIISFVAISLILTFAFSACGGRKRADIAGSQGICKDGGMYTTDSLKINCDNVDIGNIEILEN